MKKTVLLMLVLALPVLLLNCAKPADQQQGGQQAVSAKLPIKVGTILAVTGKASFLGSPEEKTIKMLVQGINAQGGVNGHKLELIYKDTAGSPEKALSFAKQLIEEEKVTAIIGPSTSGETMKIKSLCEQTKTILLSCAAAEVIVNPVAKYVFKTPQKDSQAVRKIYKTLKDLNIKKVGIAYGGTGFGVAGEKQLRKIAPSYGITVVISEKYAPNATDLTGLLNKIKAANVEAVVNWSIVPAQAIIIKNKAQMNWNVPLLQSHGFGNIKYVQMAGAAAEGVIFPAGRLLVADVLPASNPQKQVLLKYKNDYEAKYQEPVSTFGGHAYDSLMILVKAIEKAGDDKEKIRDTIENMKGFVGTGGVFNFSPTDHNGLDLDAFAMQTVKNGKFVLYQ